MNAQFSSTDFAVSHGLASRGLILDVTRLLTRALHPTPTGIDRVEFAWTRYLANQSRIETWFQAWVPLLGRRQFSGAALNQYLNHLEARWRGQPKLNDRSAVAALVWASSRAKKSNRQICLSLSHQKLDDAAKLSKSRAKNGKLVVFVHDAIPSDYPEYAREGGADRHDLRLDNVFRLADAVIVNSAATARSLERFSSGSMRSPVVLVAPLGIETGARSAKSADVPLRPYFLCIGTIEPRKNHLLLLHVWRRMAETLPQSEIPQLILIGRRGWENENIVDLLDRSPNLIGHVSEKGRANDQEMATLLAGARALLMPSFVEGYGLPVAEALAAGVPVIASDLDVFREVGADVPEFIDPLDGPKWMEAILDYASPVSANRTAQLKRLSKWSPPRWEDHFETVLKFLDQL